MPAWHSASDQIAARYRTRGPPPARRNCPLTRPARDCEHACRCGEIAAELSLSYKTVANVCSELRRKLAAKNLPDLIRIAVQLVAD
jgi:hypothetical protein